MVKTYSECLEELVDSSRENVSANPDIAWDEVVWDTVDDAVKGYSPQTIQNILAESDPHEEWQVYCTDMADPDKVQEAMAYVAIRQDVIDELSEEDLSNI